jgi:hypothetical protein
VRRRGRLTKRERITAVNGAHRLWGALSGKTDVAESLCTALPKQRAAAKPSGRILERNVLPQVMRVLRADPRVARVERNQSGVFQEGERMIRVGFKGKLDLTVYLHGGAWGELEVKRDADEKPKEHQIARIRAVRAMGGFSGWCWSAESALALLP